MRIHSITRMAAAVALVPAAALCASAVAAPATVPKPVVTATLTGHGPAISGPRTWRPGAARIAVVSHAPDDELTLLHFRAGYSYARFLVDAAHARGHGAAGRTALRRIFAMTIFDGGVDLFRGQSASFTAVVRPGTYYLGEMTGRPELTPIRIFGPPLETRLASTGLVTTTDSGYRIAGRTLPASGTITIRNAGSRGHRVNLIPVRPGTTRAELGAYLRRTGARHDAPPPSFALRGPQLGTAVLSAHGRMQLTYALPRGDYAIVDFGQDMATGRPEALEGMYAIVTLR